MSLSYRLVTLVALPGAVCACRPGQSAHVADPVTDVAVSIEQGAVVAPDSVAAGWARVRVEEDGAGHILVFFRLAESATDADLAAFLAALDTASATPRAAIALGGPEVGDVGEVVLQLTPGRYVLGCVSRDSAGHRHASTGEAKLLIVTDGPVTADRMRPPAATQEMRMVDFAYVGPERWPAGTHMLRVENAGRQDHQFRLARLRPGSSIQDWMNAEDPSDIGPAIAGVARMGPGAVAYLPVELPAGGYVAYCLISDPSSGRQHVEMGMFRAIQVE